MRLTNAAGHLCSLDCSARGRRTGDPTGRRQVSSIPAPPHAGRPLDPAKTLRALKVLPPCSPARDELRGSRRVEDLPFMMLSVSLCSLLPSTRKATPQRREVKGNNVQEFLHKREGSNLGSYLDSSSSLLRRAENARPSLLPGAAIPRPTLVGTALMPCAIFVMSSFLVGRLVTALMLLPV